MHLRETQYIGLPFDQIDSTVSAVVDQLPMVTGLPGFRDAYVVVSRDTGRVSCMTVWDSELDMRNSESAAASGLASAVAQGTGNWRDAPRVERYEVVDHQTG
jgi:heme-degrading monooxygenase HmoA